MLCIHFTLRSCTEVGLKFCCTRQRLSGSLVVAEPSRIMEADVQGLEVNEGRSAFTRRPERKLQRLLFIAQKAAIRLTLAYTARWSGSSSTIG